MKKKKIGRLLLLLLLFCLGQAAYGEEIGGKFGLFDLYCVQDEEVTALFTVVKLRDPATGADYLVSSDSLEVFQGEYEFYLTQGDYQEKVTLAGTQSGLCFLNPADVEGYPVYTAETSGGRDLTAAQIQYYYEDALEIFEADLSDWEETDPGIYDSNEKLEYSWLLGCPVIQGSVDEVIGIISCVGGDPLRLAMVDLSQVSFPEKWAVGVSAAGSEPVEQDESDEDEKSEEETTADGNEGNGGGETPAEDFGSGETESVSFFPEIPIWVWAAAVLICVAAILSLRGKLKGKQETAGGDENASRAAAPGKQQAAGQHHGAGQAAIRPVEPGTGGCETQAVDFDGYETHPAEDGGYETRPVSPEQPHRLVGEDGALKGRSYEIRGICWIGRTADCQIRYPENTGGISRHHCELLTENGKLLLMDVGSTYGTYLGDGTKLEKNIPRELKSGDTFYLADRKQMFRVE